MALTEDLPWTCRCGAANVSRSRVSWTFTASPEDAALLQTLLSNSFHVFPCFRCGYQAVVDRDLLVIHHAERWAIQCAHDPAMRESIVPQLVNGFSTYRTRVVADRLALVERARLLHGGIDDLAIEFARFEQAQRLGLSRDPSSRLLFERLEAHDVVFALLHRGTKTGELKTPLEHVKKLSLAYATQSFAHHPVIDEALVYRLLQAAQAPAPVHYCVRLPFVPSTLTAQRDGFIASDGKAAALISPSSGTISPTTPAPAPEQRHALPSDAHAIETPLGPFTSLDNHRLYGSLLDGACHASGLCVLILNRPKEGPVIAPLHRPSELALCTTLPNGLKRTPPLEVYPCSVPRLLADEDAIVVLELGDAPFFMLFRALETAPSLAATIVPLPPEFANQPVVTALNGQFLAVASGFELVLYARGDLGIRPGYALQAADLLPLQPPQGPPPQAVRKLPAVRPKAGVLSLPPEGAPTPPQAAEARPEPPRDAAPSGPSVGVIESYEPADAVGNIRTDDGIVIRFGRSDCGFEPVVGTRVEVLGTKPGFRGALRATAVRLHEQRETHANRLGARDQERGLRAPSLPAQEFASASREIGGLTLLFDEQLPREIGGMLAWAVSLGLSERGMTVEVEGSRLLFTVRGVRVGTLFGHEPYPREQLDCAQLSPSFSTGKSALTLVFTFMPWTLFTKQPDGWLERGHLRAMSRLAALLIERGGALAVVVQRAGGLVQPAKSFLHQLANLNDPECIPFLAWTTLRETRAGELTSSGLRALGLPEVRVALTTPTPWEAARRKEAVRFASYCLCRGMWIENGLFEVPRGLHFDAYPPQMIDPVDVERWDAALDGDGVAQPLELVLYPRDDSDDPLTRWSAGTLGHGGYEALLVMGLKQLNPMHEIGSGRLIEQPRLFRILTFALSPEADVNVTSGLGRARRPGVEQEGPGARVELMTIVPAEASGLLREFLQEIARRSIVAPDLAPWRVYRAPDLGAFLVRPMGVVPFKAEPSVSLLELLPLTWAEADSAESATTLEQRFSDLRPSESLQRWNKRLADSRPD